MIRVVLPQRTAGISDFCSERIIRTLLVPGLVLRFFFAVATPSALVPCLSFLLSGAFFSSRLPPLLPALVPFETLLRSSLLWRLVLAIYVDM